MNKTNKMVPKLRFPEFSLNWNLKKIKDISAVIGGGTPKTEISEYWDGDINWFTPSEIGNKYVFESNKKITKKGLKNSSAKILPENTILLSTRATIGEVSISKNIATTNQGFQSLIVKDNYNYEFVYYLIQLLKKDMIRLSSGSTFLEISKKQIEKIPIFIPSLKEQEKIASFLNQIDEKITLLKKKHQYYQGFKKYLMQSIFSQKLRFNGFDEDWETYKLKELCSIVKGKQLNKDNMIEDGKYYVLNGGINPSGYTDEWNTVENTISISEGGNCGYVNFNTEKFWSGGHCYTLNSLKNDLNVYYMFSYLKSIESKIMKLGVGSGIKNIQKGDIESIQINVPTTEEQNQIAIFIQNTDNKINLLSSQISQMEEFKKGLLQQMFI